MNTKTKILANANAKGGVGKTTNTMGLCYALSHMGFDVLLIDGDPQASSTSNLGLDDIDNLNTIDQLLDPVVQVDLNNFRKAGFDTPLDYWNAVNQESYSWERIQQFIYTPTFKEYQRNPENRAEWILVDSPFGGNRRMDLIPSSIIYSTCDTNMGRASRNFGGIVYEGYIYDFVSVIAEQNIYDFIIIDLPPQLSSISVNMLRAAVDGIILNSNLDFQSIRGFDTITAAVESILANHPEHRGILGILFSMYSSVRKVDQSIEEIAKEYVPIPVFDTRIPESSDARKAILQGRVFNQINKKAKKAYDDFATEIVYAMKNPEAPIGSNKKLLEEKEG